MDARSQTPDSSTRADGLVDDLNALLDVLALSSPTIRLEAPHDLTPSLILALLESMLRARLPIPQATREARSKGAKVDAMKIFLGVLEADVLQEEIGLSEVDPRRLANGEWDEVVLVGRVLVWVAKGMGYLPSSSNSNPPSHPPSPKPRRPPMHGPRDSITTTGTGTGESFTNVFVVRPRARYPGPGSPIPSSHPSRTPSPSPVDDTTALGLSFDPPRVSSPPRVHDEEDEEDDDNVHRRDDRSLVHEHEHQDDERTEAEPEAFCTCEHEHYHTHTHGHEHDDPDASTASTYCTCPHDSSSVRYDGWIERVDDLDAYTNTGMPRAQRSRELQQLYPGAFIRAREGSAGPAPSTSRAGAGAFTSRADSAASRTSTARPASAAPPSSSSHAGSAAPRTSSSRAAPPPSNPTTRAASAAPSTTRTPTTSTPTSTSTTRAPSSSRRYSQLTRGPGLGTRNPTRHVSPAQHTLALMNERARLLAELASVRAGSARR